MQEMQANCSDVPSPFNTKECRELRKRIQAHRIKRLGWSEFVFRYVMKGLGYGESLRDLDETQLRDFYKAICNYRRDPAARYDRQGRYMHKLIRELGWTDLQIKQYLTLTYSKTHWNVLTQVERDEVIATLIAAKEVYHANND